MSDYLLLIVGAIFVNNIILARYLGNCPFLGCSTRIDTASGMAMAVSFVVVMASGATWIVETYILVPYNLEYLETIAFILVIAALVQFVEMFLQKSVPALYQALGIYLPLITTNCAVLGIAILAVQNDYNFVKTLVYAFAASVGYGLALIILTGIRERYAVLPIPVHLRGTSIGLVTVGLLALAFLGFAGLV
ncbi:MAG: electron transport complex subunit RsxA [Deltaproteobacteria bacterium]